MDRGEVERLVRAAGGGDQAAFDHLVERFSGLVWAVVRGHRLSDADAQDVFQTTWLRLVEHLDRLRDPRAIGGWLATTARHESLRMLRHGQRVEPSQAHDLDTIDLDLPEHGDALVGQERDRALWAALGDLDDRCERLVRMLAVDPPPTYQDVAVAMDMPIGSIGPTRGRCLTALRAILRTRGITTVAGYSG